MVFEQMQSHAPGGSPDTSLLVVEDDDIFRKRLEAAMTKRGYRTRCAGSVEAARCCIAAFAPGYAVVDMKLRDGSGLDVLEALHLARPDARSIILTGYGDIPTAVSAVQLGATDYLTKPATADEINAALRAPHGTKPAAPARPLAPNEVKKAHIRWVLDTYAGNVTEAARRLNMYRSTLQRILERKKRA